MNEPIKWERVPVEGTDLGYQMYRSMIDGKGWLVVMIPARASALPDEAVAPTFIPDENNKWGQ